MTITVPLTINGEAHLNGRVIPKEEMLKAVDAWKEILKYNQCLGHFRRPGHEPMDFQGYSHKVSTAFNSNNGESFAVIETIPTPEGEELQNVLGTLEYQDRYEFQPRGFLENGEFSISTIDVVEKRNPVN